MTVQTHECIHQHGLYKDIQNTHKKILSSPTLNAIELLWMCNFVKYVLIVHKANKTEKMLMLASDNDRP